MLPSNLTDIANRNLAAGTQGLDDHRQFEMKQLRPRDQRRKSHPGATNVSMMNRTEEENEHYTTQMV